MESTEPKSRGKLSVKTLRIEDPKGFGKPLGSGLGLGQDGETRRFQTYRPLRGAERSGLRFRAWRPDGPTPAGGTAVRGRRAGRGVCGDSGRESAGLPGH